MAVHRGFLVPWSAASSGSCADYRRAIVPRRRFTRFDRYAPEQALTTDRTVATMAIRPRDHRAFSAMKTLLVTGAAGRIGTFLRPELAGKYKLRLSDLVPIRDLRPGETFVKADIASLRDMMRVTRGVDAVLHLGGQSGEAPFDRILQANIVGFYNTLEAARQNGVKRFLVATSNHAVGFYRCDQTIDHRVYPKPDSRYGVSKVFNEALASLYADRYGMEMFCMRIGNVNRAPIDRRRLAIWISGRDMAQLVTIGIEHPDIRFEVVYGISDNQRTWFDNANARRLGYRPQDRSEDYAQEILQRTPPPGDLPADIYQGGGHCMAEGNTRSTLAGESPAKGASKPPARPRKKAAANRPVKTARKFAAAKTPRSPSAAKKRRRA